MFKIKLFLISMFFRINLAHADNVIVVEFSEKELAELEVRKVRGADNKTRYTVESN